MPNISEDTGKGVLRNLVTYGMSRLYHKDCGYSMESPVITTSHPNDHSVTYNVSVTLHKEN